MPALSQRSILYAQNFLTSACLVDALLDRCRFEPGDILYEIGPGKGIITERLASRCSHIVAIEKDPHLAEALRCRFDGVPNITIHAGDFLQFHLPDTHYKVFASIPFNITTAIVTRLTTAPCAPDDAYLVVQKEAAGKFLGRPRESLYAVLVKPWFELDVVHRFRRRDFVPTPRVDVVMLRLRKRGPPQAFTSCPGRPRRSTLSCHPERGEGSLCPASQTLREARGDTRRHAAWRPLWHPVWGTGMPWNICLSERLWRGPPLIRSSERQLFRDFVVYGFTARQPCLASTFKGIFTPQQFKRLGKKLGFDLDATPTLLQFEQWLELFDYFKRMSNTRAMQVIAESEKRLRRQQAGLEKMHRTRVSSSPGRTTALRSSSAPDTSRSRAPLA